MTGFVLDNSVAMRWLLECLKASEAFGPKYQIQLTIGPVVKPSWKGRQ
jgi:hypothetical protein